MHSDLLIEEISQKPVFSLDKSNRLFNCFCLSLWSLLLNDYGDGY